jgi:hypothetical protein
MERSVGADEDQLLARCARKGQVGARAEGGAGRAEAGSRAIDHEAAFAVEGTGAGPEALTADGLRAIAGCTKPASAAPRLVRSSAPGAMNRGDRFLEKSATRA